jgi:DNA-binding NarL/FixJ family response regulator
MLERDMRRILEGAGFQLLPSVRDEENLLRTLRSDRPDLCLLDIELGGVRDGVDLARDIYSEFEVPAVFVSAHCDADTVARAVLVSPHAFVVKPFSERQLLTSIELAFSRLDEANKRKSMENALAKIADTLADTGLLPSPRAKEIDIGGRPEVSTLSLREREVLRELLANRRVPTIAKSLGISPSTVRNHLKSIFQKVGVHSQAELIDLFLKGAS